MKTAPVALTDPDRAAPPMALPTFAEAFCARQGIPATAFDRTVFSQALYRHARFVALLCRVMNKNHFAADLDLVRAAGRLRRLRDLADEIADFNHHPANVGFWRTQLKLRLSTTRLRALMRATLPRADSVDTAPVG